MSDRDIDSLGIVEATLALPEQVSMATRALDDVVELPDRAAIENVVVLGMGGSGVAGDVLVTVAGPFLPLPVVVLKNYVVPAFVNESSLVFAVSFSGNTEETIEAAEQAAVQGARIVGVTQGGLLADRCASWGSALLRVPSTIPVPRAGVGALAIPPLLALEAMGLFPGASQWVDRAIEQLRARAEELRKPSNIAEDLARDIGRTIPVLYGGGSLGAVAARRWKTQINENAKAPAFANELPEMCHNEIAGWGQHGDVTRQVFTVVSLRHDDEHPQVMHRFAIAHEMIEEVVASVLEVEAAGDGRLAQLFDLFLVGDMVSVHMAMREGVDPGPVPVLDEMKDRLRD
jgi:glucose/mannose-6-phosphate isomerase